MPYRTLNAERISKTLDRLEARIADRFPEKSLRKVCRELAEIGRKAEANVAAIARPYWLTRLFAAALVAAGSAMVVTIVREIKAPSMRDWDAVAFFEGTDALLNTMVLVGAGVFFLVTLEERLKRRRILADLHEIRSIVHVVDMHQLTKDPVAILNPHLRTPSSPVRDDMTAFELNRYLDYCAEMLSLSAKLAALYAQNMRDPVVIAAVNEIEILTAGLSAKIWQKIMLIRRADEFDHDLPAPATAG
ncbi:MAG: hypothetical protein MI723_14165 [Caulobacterales bacterium]|nr:hypothetical protein [Caulobacterales bacterium]